MLSYIMYLSCLVYVISRSSHTKKASINNIGLMYISYFGLNKYELKERSTNTFPEVSLFEANTFLQCFVSWLTHFATLGDKKYFNHIRLFCL